jgi:hypothetical protein
VKMRFVAVCSFLQLARLHSLNHIWMTSFVVLVGAMSDEVSVYLLLLLAIIICLVRSFWKSSEAKTDFSQSFQAAVDWYRSSGVGDIIRDAIANEFAGVTEGDPEKLLKTIKDTRART